MKIYKNIITIEFLIILFLAVYVFVLTYPIIFKNIIFDEQVYFYFSWMIRQGLGFYNNAWFDDKGPTIYILYMIPSIFKENTLNIISLRIFTIIYQLITMYAFLKVSSKFFNKERYIKYISTFLFITLYFSDLFEGLYSNADNFILLPILLSIYFFLNSRILISAFIMGISFSIKQNTALELLPIIIVYIINYLKNKEYYINIKVISGLIKSLLKISICFLLPYVMYSIYFLYKGMDIFNNYMNHVFLDRITSHIMDFNMEYLKRYFGAIYAQTNVFWILTVIYLAIFLLKVSKRKKYKIGNNDIFLFWWIIFSAISVSIGGKFFPHYFLEFLPVLVIAPIYLVYGHTQKIAYFIIFIIIASVNFKYQYIVDRFYLMIGEKKQMQSSNEKNISQAIEFLKKQEIKSIFSFDYEPLTLISIDKMPVNNYAFKYLYIDYYKVVNQKIYSTIRGQEERTKELLTYVQEGKVEYIVINASNIINQEEINQLEFLNKIVNDYQIIKTFDNVWIYKYQGNIGEQTKTEYVIKDMIFSNEKVYLEIERQARTPDIFIDIQCPKSKSRYPENGIDMPLKVIQTNYNIKIEGTLKTKKVEECHIHINNMSGEIIEIPLISSEIKI